ncbi:hypothetical protein PHMEG_00013745 [Phytophthora megakarya]|uniref:Uncharacterized protein n=1 Tax=Phytophthora megakarya TaxID=4795 RepID=A0A225W7N3_9STRA|nr:hypothetical protein PHMEG_00013745 [Phytophthora megakarya]
MVRASGFSGDIGFHIDSSTENIKINLEQAIEASADSGSSLTSLNEPESTERQRDGKISAGAKRRFSDGPEAKPHPPSQAPSGSPRIMRISLSTKIDEPSSTPSASSRVAKKKSKPKASRKKLNPPDSNVDDSGVSPTDIQLTRPFLR